MKEERVTERDIYYIYITYNYIYLHVSIYYVSDKNTRVEKHSQQYDIYK